MSQLARKSELYLRHHGQGEWLEFVYAGAERIELFQRYVGGPGREVLDVGCRAGALSRAYLQSNRVVGVDVNSEALLDAARLGIETHLLDAEEPLPFADESFDAVVAGELLEHLADPARFVAEVQRLLRPSGIFVGSVPNAFRLKNRLRFLIGRRPEEDLSHLHLFAPGDIAGLLADFDHPQLHLIAGRFVPLHPRLFANDIVFAGQRHP